MLVLRPERRPFHKGSRYLAQQAMKLQSLLMMDNAVSTCPCPFQRSVLWLDEAHMARHARLTTVPQRLTTRHGFASLPPPPPPRGGRQPDTRVASSRDTTTHGHDRQPQRGGGKGGSCYLHGRGRP